MKIEEFLNSPIVIDNGSGYIKAGFSGEEKPSLVFPSMYQSYYQEWGDQNTKSLYQPLLNPKSILEIQPIPKNVDY